MKRKLLFLLVLSGSLFSGCKKETGLTVEMVDGNPVYSLNIDLVSDTLDVPLSRFISSCEMIVLENCEEALFGTAHHTEISENYIAIKSHRRIPLKLFSREGRYLGEIGKIGRGPGEYTALIDVQIDEENACLYLMPFGTVDRIYKYAFNGEFLGEILLHYTLRKFAARIEGERLTAINMPFRGDSVLAFTQTLDGKLISSLPPTEGMYAQSFDSEIIPGFHRGKYDFHITASDTLFHFLPSENRMQASFTASRTVTEDFWFKVFSEIPGYVHVSSGVWVNGVATWHRLLVDKEMEEVYYARFRNDFFGNIPFQFFFHNDRFVNNISALEFRNQLEKSLESGDLDQDEVVKIMALIGDIEVEDNNIILTGRLK